MNLRFRQFPFVEILFVVIVGLFVAAAWNVYRQWTVSNEARQQECVQRLTLRLENNELVGTPSSQLAGCLQLADEKWESESREIIYKFERTPRKNQEGPASLWITVDPKSQTVIRAELVFPDW